MSSPLPFEISVEQTKQLIDQDEPFLLLDVREQAEHDIAHIAGSRLVPMSEIQARVGELEDARNQRVVVHCHHGGRSEQVAQWLASLGFEQVQNMAGGIDRWALQIDTSLQRY